MSRDPCTRCGADMEEVPGTRQPTVLRCPVCTWETVEWRAGP